MAKQKSLIEYVWNHASKAFANTLSVGENSDKISYPQLENLMSDTRRYIKNHFPSNKPYILSFDSKGNLQFLMRTPGTQFYAKSIEDEILKPVGFCFSSPKRVQLNLGHGKSEYCEKYVVQRGKKK